ncbi:MAG TPA: response regulator [Minicystis sp.]|nr:response regulator [Minicystis sp.]
MQHGASILVVDDDADCREVVAMLLEGEGHAVATVPDGAEALRTLEEEPAPDLVVLDLMMPRINGAEVLSAMRADGRLRDVPVVLVSAAPPTLYEALRRDPLVRVAPKPIEVDAFLAAIASLLPRTARTTVTGM